MSKRADTVARARATLEQKRSDLLRRWREALADEADLLEDRQIEPEDGSTDQREAALIDLLGERELAQLAAIEEALARVHEGQHGICTRCEQPIAEGRLRVLPEAKLCVTCTEMDEEIRAPLHQRPTWTARGV